MKRGLKPQAVEAVRMAAEGVKRKDIAEHFGVTVGTIDRWITSEEAHEEYVRQMKAIVKHSFTKAVHRLDKQIDSENEWIAQGASREIIGRYGASVLGEDKQEITVHITGGMPDVGMPDRTDDE